MVVWGIWSFQMPNVLVCAVAEIAQKPTHKTIQYLTCILKAIFSQNNITKTRRCYVAQINDKEHVLIHLEITKAQYQKISFDTALLLN